MADVMKTRISNLRALIEQWDGTGNLAKKLGYTNGSTLAQMAGRNPTRPITEKMARKVEHDLDLPAGWMDSVHKTESVDATQVSQAIQIVGVALQDAGKSLDPVRFADVAAFVYEYALTKSGTSLTEFARRLVKLL